MAKRTCSVAECGRPSVARGYCKPHHSRFLRYGDPQGKVSDLQCEAPDCEEPMRSLVSRMCRSHAQRMAMYGTIDRWAILMHRLMAQVEESPDGCWLWTGLQNRPGGYGIMAAHEDPKSNVYTHRVAWELYRGDIPDGLTIDHLCRNTLCCNPWHLDPVPQSVNHRRWAESVTHCPNGHRYTRDVVGSGEARCDECLAATRARSVAQRRVARARARRAA